MPCQYHYNHYFIILACLFTSLYQPLHSLANKKKDRVTEDFLLSLQKQNSLGLIIIILYYIRVTIGEKYTHIVYIFLVGGV